MLGGFLRRTAALGEERSGGTFSLRQLGQLLAVTSPATPSSVTDPDLALKNAAVWACIDILAGSVASLPVDSIRQQGPVRVPVTPTPSLLTSPSAVVSPDVWFYQVMWGLLTDGNTFGIITTTDPMMRPTTIELVDPEDVHDRRFENGVASVTINDERRSLYPLGDVWHVPGRMTKPGSPFALSPMHHAGRSIAAGLAAEAFGSQFFTEGGHPTGILRTDQELTREQAEGAKQKFIESTRNKREPVVMGSGFQYSQLQINPDDSQFIDLMRFEVEQVCRFFRVPPSMVYGAVSGQSVTYANVSQADLHYLKHSLDGYLVRIERALTALLPRPQIVKFNRDALLRTDTTTRYQAHQVALAAGFLTVDEVRELEDRPPLPDAPDPQEGSDVTPD